MGDEAAIVDIDLSLREADAALRHVVQGAYLRGYQAGLVAAKSAIDRLTQGAPLDQPERKVSMVEADKNKGGVEGAPKLRRGSIATHLLSILPEIQPASIPDIRNAARGRDIEITLEGIGNELRRNAGVRYLREGSKWILIGGAEKKTAGEAQEASPADHQSQTEGGRLGTAPLI